MEHLDQDRPTTPPHQPTAGVRILRKEIEIIAGLGFPDHDMISVTQAPFGKSYNNRIYYLQLRQTTVEKQAVQKFVLKVNGRFFGPSKIQNEVSCLRLVQKYCPSVPAPRALAWSEDGHVATFATPFRTESCSIDIPTGLDTLSHGRWILMTRQPGSPLAEADLDDVTIMSIANQLGDIVACWRQSVPTQNCCGNIRLPAPNDDETDNKLMIRGALHIGIDAINPVTHINDYYKAKLEKSLARLQTTNSFARSRYLIEPIQGFIRDTLPQLDLGSGRDMDPNEFVFTHYDLSPRNILISGHPPRVTGIVDFEFSGFFPAVEEFLNDAISNKRDFPRVFYNTYLEHLRMSGVATPAAEFDSNLWNRNYWLENLALRIAPWDLPGDYRGEELESQLEKAEWDIRDMLEHLYNAL
ncbi:hypothetical protein NM208_g4842 [Fusarium decemcellulare]|uniref:Uncharacterized protein n=1 Tax=Fusarium decemcellulare TaxID=57161 RepID=A0ACC1SJ87_9HYPO|nr:hypothetical protein NM208_g4842 [Fusarium decemcellulare]